ncbi:hypothetical protein CASFOL_029587 [Castilleja foliolosa]|uniref:NADP-dependent oxidoreductase domain-containing protein n=1 Tax=Castilleja foliolosa TaxID=1961234 RepID=A0ABD3C896_9LAMI
MAVPLVNLAPDMAVSRLCLGTMTFGEQNSLPQSFQLLDRAFESGINFFDSAEMFVSGAAASGNPRTERGVYWTLDSIQEYPTRSSRSCYEGLSRLQSDYIDLYQVHWPDRYVPMFGETEYDQTRTFPYVSFEEQLGVLDKAVSAGKIRYVGLSNETPYGLMKFLHAAEGVFVNARIVSVQNSYNLFCRNFDSGMAECCHHERVSLLAYSPLAMGILSGKYLSLDGGPADSRMNLFRGKYAEGESRYSLSNDIIRKATELYVSIAEKHGVHPVSLAIAFVLRHPMVASAVFGVTKLWQLEQVLNSCTVQLTPDIVAEIDEVHSAYPNPCP